MSNNFKDFVASYARGEMTVSELRHHFLRLFQIDQADEMMAVTPMEVQVALGQVAKNWIPGEKSWSTGPEISQPTLLQFVEWYKNRLSEKK